MALKDQTLIKEIGLIEEKPTETSVWMTEARKEVAAAILCAEKATGDQLRRQLKSDVYYIAHVDNIGAILLQRHTKFLSAIAGHHLMKKTDVRAKVMAYMFSVVMKNCIGTDFDKANALMEKMGAFDYEHEISAYGGKWERFPLSGSLYNDVRINFVARKAKKKTMEESVEFIEVCLKTAREQFLVSVITHFAMRAALPRTPFFDGKQYDCWEDEVTDYLEVFAQKESSYAQKQDDISFHNTIANHVANEYFPAGAKLENYHESAVAFEDASIYEYPGDMRTMEFSAATHSTDVFMSAPNNAGKGVNFSFIFGDDLVEELEQVIDEIEEDEENDRDVQSQIKTRVATNKALHNMRNVMLTRQAITAAALIDRERLELQLARQTIEKKQSKTKEEAPVVADLRKTIERAKGEVAALKQALAEKERKLAAQTDKIRRLEATLQTERASAKKAKNNEIYLAEEVDALLTQLEMAQGNRGEEEALELDEPVDTSVFDNLDVVVVGGHQSWATAMRPFHKNVKIYDAEAPMPADEVIYRADIVWIQPNSISHPKFWKAVAAAKQRHVPVRYFAYAGHKQCKKQIVSETAAVLGLCVAKDA